MSNNVPNLLRRNLHEVFGENDSKKRWAAIEEIYSEDIVFHAPNGIFRGRSVIERVAGEIRAKQPDFRYVESGPAEDLADTAGRVSWVSGRPDEAPSYAGTDFILAADGKITAIYLFFDRLPA
ncbi:nuclear transport factor 2 family protein [Glacieibacterium megasporae]|uniref:nuclear transport factor 2 family protein n=1 Tax=Glacieibacterium megasporae TaxID=2835787 RepID=UPI001CAA5517|nr:nuclear transport factor 2 family protein [Polymorphobacter megasporae]UAJ12948.1 nuclear transport factor 2 family protein [Polymorphobacter megasporae]